MIFSLDCFVVSKDSRPRKSCPSPLAKKPDLTKPVEKRARPKYRFRFPLLVQENNDTTDENHYGGKADLKELLVKQFAKAYAAIADSQAKKTIREAVLEMRKAFGDRPGALALCKRAKRDSAAQWLDRARQKI